MNNFAMQVRRLYRVWYQTLFTEKKTQEVEDKIKRFGGV